MRDKDDIDGEVSKPKDIAPASKPAPRATAQRAAIDGEVNSLRDIPRNIKPLAPVGKVVEPVTAPLSTAPEQPAALPELAEPLQKWCFQSDVPIFTLNDLTGLTPTAKKLNTGNVVTVKRQHVFPGDDSLWSEISCITYEKVLNKDIWNPIVVSGWVNDLFLDDYTEEFSGDSPENSVVIPHPSADPVDAQQYLTLVDDAGFEDRIRYNMCGELCVAFILQDNIDNVVANWKNKLISAYGNILGKGKNETTSQGNLSDLLHANLGLYGFGNDADQVVSFREKLTFPMSFERMRNDLGKSLVTHALIVLVRIDHTSGTLIGNTKPGTDHWMVVDKLNGSRLEIYNPFPNKREEYSIGEFYSSCLNSWAGLWVKRKSATGYLAASPSAPVFGIQLDTPRPVTLLAEQYIAREGGVKHNLCGEFCVAYILGKSADEAIRYWKDPLPGHPRTFDHLKAYGYYKAPGQSKSFTIGTVLDYWRENQPELYKTHVIGDKPTGAAELKTILKAYGYTNPGDTSDFRTGLTDKLSGQYLPTPGKMKKKLETHFFIAGVGIEGVHGRLVYDGPIRHWVVVEAIQPTGKHYTDPSGRRGPVHFGGNGGWVQLYNPFSNIIEEYSYLEFTNSMGPTGGWDGMWVKRSVNPLFVPQEVMLPVPEAVASTGKGKGKDSQVVKKWSDQRMAEEIQKRVKNKVPRERIPASLVKDNDTGWSPDKIAALLPSQQKQENTVDIEKSLTESQAVKSIQSEVVAWVRNTAKSNSALALEITHGLRETGLLVVEESQDQGKVGRLLEPNEPTLPDKLQAAIDSRIDGRIPASQLTQKVASVIVPLFTARAMDGVKALREAAIPKQVEKASTPARPKTVFVPSETVVPSDLYIFSRASYWQRPKQGPLVTATYRFNGNKIVDKYYIAKKGSAVINYFNSLPNTKEIEKITAPDFGPSQGVGDKGQLKFLTLIYPGNVVRILPDRKVVDDIEYGLVYGLPGDQDLADGIDHIDTPHLVHTVYGSNNQWTRVPIEPVIHVPLFGSPRWVEMNWLEQIKLPRTVTITKQDGVMVCGGPGETDNPCHDNLPLNTKAVIREVRIAKGGIWGRCEVGWIGLRYMEADQTDWVILRYTGCDPRTWNDD